MSSSITGTVWYVCWAGFGWEVKLNTHLVLYCMHIYPSAQGQALDMHSGTLPRHVELRSFRKAELGS